MKSMTLLVSSFVAIAMLSACTGQSEVGPGPVKEEVKPVTVRFFLWGAYSDELWQQMFVDPVKKKYPHITLEKMVRGTAPSLNELVAAGEFPDIFTTPNDALSQFVLLDLARDMTPMIKQENIDISKFDPAQIDRSKRDNQLIALPFFMAPNVMFYNKDIFDRYGEPYPKDGLYWDEVVELAKRLTRSENGFQTKGLHPQNYTQLAQGLPIGVLDPKTDRATVNNDTWKNMLTTLKQIVTIPGNEPQGVLFRHVVKAFVEDRNTAMVISNVMGSIEQATKNGLNWDIAQAPSFRGSDGINSGGQTMVMGISKSSKNADAAMKVLSVLTSEEVQGMVAKKLAVIPALSSKDVRDGIGKEMPFLNGKNVQSMFKGKVAPYSGISVYVEHADIKKIMENKVNDYVTDKKDLNTALREAEEEINKQIDQIKK